MSDLADVRERLARIETKLDAVLPLEKRLRSVENKQNWLAGVGTAVGIAVGLVVRSHS